MWKSPTRIVNEYNLRDRSTIYRHAHALDLFSERTGNVCAALEKIIEKVEDVDVNAAAIVQAIATYARINAQAQLLARDQLINLIGLLKKMTNEELDAHAKDGTLPPRLARALGATPPHGPGGSRNG